MRVATILFLLLVSTGLFAQRKYTTDFSSKIELQRKVASNAKSKQITVKEYKTELHGTLVVTGVVENNKVFLSSVIVEYPNLREFSKAQNMIKSDCVTNTRCETMCIGESDSVRLICFAACAIFCL